MPGNGYLPGRETYEDPRVVKATAKRDNRKPDPAKDAEYARELARETEVSLRLSPARWRQTSSRADLAARPARQVSRPKTHCPKGHPYDSGNTYWSAGHRKCRACLRSSREAAR